MLKALLTWLAKIGFELCCSSERDFNPLWNCKREREDVFKLNCLDYDGKFRGRKWKISVTSVEALR